MASTSDESEKRYSGYIYNLINNLTGEIFYTGSTCQNLKQRLSEHKSNSFNIRRLEYDSKKCKYIRDVGKDNFRIEMIVTFEELIKQEKLRLEKYYMEQNGMNTNTQIPCRSKKDYYNDNKEEITKVCHCNECGFKYTQANKAKHLKSKLHADGKRLCDIN